MHSSISPKHIAIIMDGNGRWAKQRSLPRLAGHRAGVEAARKLIRICANKHLPVLSLFAFSSENWHRPLKEVNYLMNLFVSSLQREADILHKHNIQLRFIGDRGRFSALLSKQIAEIENLTRANTGMTLVIAIDYGGQWDICEATRRIAEKIEAKKLTSSAITPAVFAQHLSFSDLPNPDLFIRTSGEVRLSNFMLWQLAYCELYFTKTLWPDFNAEAFDLALEQYASRERRFGLSSDQMQGMQCLNSG